MIGRCGDPDTLSGSWTRAQVAGMRSFITTIIALALVACTNSSPDCIPAGQACAEQAVAWCAASGQSTRDCQLLYEEACSCGHPDRCIAGSAQDQCLDDIAAYSCDGGCVPSAPASCRATWADPDAPI